ncbi:hypothetical protein M501DRAFT_1033248 [Patellaria atrata CBS 101060]|uniref:C3H1-type domain-containing protein n=1 Tax=Patellaria atrata CBS 101060 TaxID=1346257 RepID=A0A9P4S6J5_9PEZI|nr:hypothetical protein M501DRAFT_1033248 [Patellaria atrata CBS 101060]
MRSMHTVTIFNLPPGFSLGQLEKVFPSVDWSVVDVAVIPPGQHNAPRKAEVNTWIAAQAAELILRVRETTIDGYQLKPIVKITTDSQPAEEAAVGPSSPPSSELTDGPEPRLGQILPIHATPRHLSSHLQSGPWIRQATSHQMSSTSTLAAPQPRKEVPSVGTNPFLKPIRALLASQPHSTHQSSSPTKAPPQNLNRALVVRQNRSREQRYQGPTRSDTATHPIIRDLEKINNRWGFREVFDRSLNTVNGEYRVRLSGLPSSFDVHKIRSTFIVRKAVADPIVIVHTIEGSKVAELTFFHQRNMVRFINHYDGMKLPICPDPPTIRVWALDGRAGRKRGRSPTAQAALPGPKRVAPAATASVPYAGRNRAPAPQEPCLAYFLYADGCSNGYGCHYSHRDPGQLPEVVLAAGRLAQETERKRKALLGLK